MTDQLQNTIVDRGKQIFSLIEQSGSKSSIFNKDWWYGRIMDWSMKNPGFKVQMFRFVDVLPYLNTPDEIARHLREYFSADGGEMPSVLSWGLGLGALAPGLMTGSIRKNVTEMARMFITGSTPDEAIKNLERMRKGHLAFTADILGEAAVSEQEAWYYQKRYLELLETLDRRAQSWEEISLIDRDRDGIIPKVNISVKASSLYSQLDPIDPERSVDAVSEKLRPILRRAMELNAFVNLDMEAYFFKDLTLRIFKTLLMETEFRDYPHFGVVTQAYLRDSENDLHELIAFAKKRGAGRLTVRLVKGAYWDYETILVRQKGWPVPVFTNKKETDANYEKLSAILLENDSVIKAAFGSHNIRSIAFALAQAEKLKIDPRSFEIQMLYGMADPIKEALVKMGFRVREYAPIGELIPGMAYLVRRLLENTSNESFLRAKFSSDVSADELLQDPRDGLDTHSDPADHEKAADAKQNPHRFFNEPALDFSAAGNREQMKATLGEIRRKLGRSYSLIIGNKEIKTGQKLASVNPANPGDVIGYVHMASKREANLAIQAARNVSKEWAATAFEERCNIFGKAAGIMGERRFELMALEVFEVGKTWREADGDIAEAMDFCRYYAQQMRRLGNDLQLSFVAGEDSIYHYRPRGVGVVIAPWNFPLAILCGMVTGAAITGNTVIMKPSGQSPVIAAWFMEILREAGLPPGVVNFLPGPGKDVGDYLVESPDVDFIVFTGSRDVGLRIINKAGQRVPGQKSVKRVIAEMGGKNAIIVDSDADLDEAITGTLYSAFGYQGQKCSACSRVIVLEENYDKFISRLIEGAKSLRVGTPEDPGSYLGPVIDQESCKRIMDMIETGKNEARLAFQSRIPSEGYYVPLTIFTDVNPGSRIAKEEIFGPVLSVFKVKDIDEALKVANSTEFALTGGIYSRSPANIERARREFEVGNLYINRGITGALVGRHPFGGFKMSGVGSKAGGPDYLLQFVEPRTVTENTMRRGFAPELD